MVKVAVIWVGLTTITLLTEMKLFIASTVAPAVKFVPVNVTVREVPG
jgi:hypothetical protein